MNNRVVKLLIKHFGSFDNNTTKENESRKIYEACHGIFIKSLMDLDYSLQNEFICLHTGDGFNCQVDIPVEINQYTGNNDAVDFFKAVEILEELREIFNKHMHDTHYSILYSGSEWFTSTLLSSHKDVHTPEIAFGSIFKNNFFAHWIINSDEFLERDIRTTFEYDTRRISIKFSNADLDIVSKEFGKFTNYYVEVQFSHIKHIFVEQKSKALVGEKTVFQIYFLLTNPPIIKQFKSFKPSDSGRYSRTLNIWKHKKERERESDLSTKDFTITESSVLSLVFNLFPDQFHEVLSRLYARTKIPIEFTTFKCRERIVSRRSNPFYPFDWNTSSLEPNIRGLNRKLVSEMEETLNRLSALISLADRNECIYLIEGLLSRGFCIKCQILEGKLSWRSFLKMIERSFKTNYKACLETLTVMIRYIDEHIIMNDVFATFDALFNQKKECEVFSELSEEQILDGYVMLRKVLITPSRLIIMPREMVMGNRAVRAKKKDTVDASFAFIRISFRDDNGKKMSTMSTSIKLIDETITKTFTPGICIAGRVYLYVGSSSSQQRDHGAYFMLGTLSADQQLNQNNSIPDISIQKFRKKLGKFEDLESVQKVMARLGQCFTQSRETGIGLDRISYERDCIDLIGGSNIDKKPYTFSDGVGTISMSFAEEIKTDMELRSTPSCFQFRFRGMKGVLSVDPNLDEKANWAKENVERNRKYINHCLFRRSQEKFRAKRYENQPLEVVKTSGVTTLTLNKPLIAVLDFACENNREVHDKIKRRIHFLLDKEIRKIAKYLSNEKYARMSLQEMPRRLNFNLLDYHIGFHLSFEPFFRGMLLANARYTINKQLNKLRISVPDDLGRGMIGVLDETGRLQYGQVFCQYTNSSTEYNPVKNAKTTVHTGPIMITKSPTMVLGDVRLFEAVDIHELHHLRDVIVFPAHGPRPHPDEMAGSDLDGDEYSVIWDPELLIYKNFHPSEYRSPTPEIIKVDMSKLNQDCAQFFINIVSQDAIGSIANSHLHNADLYHIQSEVCKSLAEKAAMALDFPKTGVPPLKLTNKWERDEEDPEHWIPPERSEHFPDFAISRKTKPGYISCRLIGELYREVKRIDDLLSTQLKQLPDVEIDPRFLVEGWQDFENEVSQIFTNYKNQIRLIMTSYGIQTEAELFSGFICEFRNRITDGDSDDQSFYNTKHIIDKRVTDLFRTFRLEFFSSFGEYMHLTAPHRAYDDSNDVLKRKAVHISHNMSKKASAYYYVAYNNAKTCEKERFLSFGWIAYDVLSEMRQSNLIRENDVNYFSSEPILERLSAISDSFVEQLGGSDQNDELNTILHSNEILNRYCIKYKGLKKIIFVITGWASLNNGINSDFTIEHLTHLFLMYALNKFGSFISLFGEGERIYIEEIDEHDTIEMLEESSLKLTNDYKLLLSFFEFASSLFFRKISHIDFSSVGLMALFLRNEWFVLHEAAAKSYYKLLISLEYSLFGEDEDVFEPVMEGEAFSVPMELDTLLPYRRQLITKLGIEDISMRSIYNGSVTILAKGTYSSLDRLSTFFKVKVDRYTKCFREPEELINYMSSQIEEKLHNLNYM